MDKDRQFAHTPVRDLPNMSEEDIVIGPREIFDISVEVNSKKDDVSKVTAEKFVSLIQAGASPTKAAEAVGTTIKRINSSQEMRQAIQELVVVANIPGEIRKALIRAGLNKLFIEALNSEDIEDRKLALAVAKQISQDPEINLGGGEGSSVNIDLGELAGTIAGLTIESIKEK